MLYQYINIVFFFLKQTGKKKIKCDYVKRSFNSSSHYCSMYELYLEEQEKTENPSNFIKAVLKKTAILFSKEFWITTYLIEERLP